MSISNYRPILLLTLFSKVFEEIMYSRLMGHLNINKILVEEHFGSRKNLATGEAIYKLTNEILRALNNMSIVGDIFCDLEKAFDSISHEILSKVTYYGTIGKAKRLLESCLRDRYQRVQFIDSNLNQNTFSKSAKVKHGVLQGLILGRLLLLLYINDLPKVIGSKAISILFSDDTNILITSPNNKMILT